eukprot:TRINITY_DN17926_c0_g1_i3.p1 TRINITY_DN17926_c0_g1~~TRINITY_DN17926_c0_g1_i3.p1  ORF type:complete len:227 (-),score=49.19 TRINITY_DN17926_c0_g1_i3:172-852(-)
MYFDSAGASIYAPKGDGTHTRRLSFPEESIGSGTLHGVWSADQPVSLSDRRLKKEVVPLHRTLLARMDVLQARPSSQPTASAAEELGSMPALQPRQLDGRRSEVTNWVLRELRPVSFVYRKGDESKTLPQPRRYGFIAQDVERVLPELVHDTGSTKYLIYQDLIAMITMVVQDLQARLDQYRAESLQLRSMVEGYDKKFSRIEEMLLRLLRNGSSPDGLENATALV